MRTGKIVVVALVVTTFTVASGAWLFQRSLMKRHARSQPPTVAPPVMPDEYQRRPAPGGVPAEAFAAAPIAAPAPGSVTSEWARKNEAAIAALESEDFARAIELLEECHAANPGIAVFAGNLAEALARAAVAEHGRDSGCTLCIDRLERAIVLAPARLELARLLEGWRLERAVEGEFWNESSQHFQLSYDGRRNDLLWGSTRLLNELEAAYGDLGLLFGFYPVESGRAKFRVVLYERAGFSLLTGLGDWAGGAFDGTAIRIPVGDLSAEESRLKRVFRHELCHAFVREYGGDSVPGWLNEGVSQWLEREHDAERNEDARQAASQLVGQAAIPLESLTGSLASWKDERAITHAYRQSLAFTGYLWNQHGSRAVLAMVAGCKQGKTPAESFLAEVRLPLADAFEAFQAQ